MYVIAHPDTGINGNLGLIATSNGYYIAQTKSEIDNYLQSLKGRENAIKAVRVSLERQRDVMYGKDYHRVVICFQNCIFDRLITAASI